MKRLLPIALAQVAGLLCGVAGVKISSHLIAPEVYGAYGIFLTFTPLGAWVTHAGLIKFVARHWAASPDRAGLLREVRGAGLRKLVWLGAVVAVAAVWFVPGLSDAAGVAGVAGRVWVFAWLFAGAGLLAFSQIAESALQAAREHWRDFAASATGSVTRTFVPLAFFAGAGGAAGALPLGFAVHAVVFAGVAWGLAGRSARGGGSGDRNGAAPFVSRAPAQLTAVYDGGLFVVLAVGAWVLMAVNRWIVAGFFGGGAAGFFTLAGNVAVIVTGILGGVFMQFWQPVFFAMPAESAEGRRALARRVDVVALGYAVCGVAGVAGLHVVMPGLVGIFISANYTGALAMIAPAGCFGVAMTTGQFFHSMLLAAREERACAVADLGGAGVLVAGGVIAAAAGGEAWFLRWLLVSPIVPWVVNRTLARGRLKIKN